MHCSTLNRDLLIGATVALALHGWLLFGVRGWYRSRPLLVHEESFVVSLVDSSPAEAPAAPASPETALPSPPEPPPPIIPPPELELPPPASVIATIAPAAPPVPSLAPAATPRPPVRPRPARGAGRAPAAPATGNGAGTSSLALPRYRSNPPPEYPAEARRLRQEGRVLLDVEVSAEGRALSVSVKRSSGVASLDEAALRAVRRWSFEPARRAGIAVAARVEVPVQFHLAN